MPLGAFKLNGLAKYLAPTFQSWDFVVAYTTYEKNFAAPIDTWGVNFNSDGTKMFVHSPTQVRQFTLTTPYDIGNTTYAGLYTHGLDSQGYGVRFNDDGSKMFISGNQNNKIYELDLSTNFDVTTASYNSVSLNTASTGPMGLAFGDTGKKLYVIDLDTDLVYQHNLSTAYDLSTASSSVGSVSIGTQETNPTDVFLSADGTKMYITGTGNDTIYSYTLSTPFSVTTATYDNDSFSVASQDGLPRGIFFTPDGTKMFMGGSSSDDVFQYSTSANRPQITVTTNGDAQISTAQSKFGGSSGLFDGTGDYLQITNPPITSEPFTIEMWVRPASTSSYMAMWEQGPGTSTNGYFRLATDANGNKFHLRTYKASSATDLDLFSTSTFSANSWYHIAITKDGNTWKLFFNGALEATGTGTVPITSTGPFKIGQVGFFSDINGHIDEFRMSNTARYTSSFTPSSTAFSNDSNTVLLLHCDGSNGSTSFTDDAS